MARGGTAMERSLQEAIDKLRSLSKTDLEEELDKWWQEKKFETI